MKLNIIEGLGRGGGLWFFPLPRPYFKVPWMTRAGAWHRYCVRSGISLLGDGLQPYDAGAAEYQTDRNFGYSLFITAHRSKLFHSSQPESSSFTPSLILPEPLNPHPPSSSILRDRWPF